MYRGDHRKFAAVVVLLTAVVLLTGGCLRSSRPTRVFVLQAETLSPLPETVFPTQFFVAAVNLPDYLKRWQIIRRKDNFEIVIDWFSSWNELPGISGARCDRTQPARSARRKSGCRPRRKQAWHAWIEF